MQAQLNVCKAVKLWAFVVESVWGLWGRLHVMRDLDEILSNLSCSSNAEYACRRLCEPVRSDVHYCIDLEIGNGLEM